jgi:transcriptional regulator with XRE-family HTH domain
MRPGGCDVSHVSRAPAPDPALAVVLKRLREDRGLTQEALAFKSGVSISSLGRIETGHTSAAWTTVRQLAAALGVSMGELGSMVDVER